MQKKYEGRAAWKNEHLEDHLQPIIFHAIIREKTISIEWTEEYGEKTYTTLTQTKGSKYTGKSVWAHGLPKEQHGVVEAVLYSNEDGHVLVGEETWPGQQDWFIIQLFNGTDLE